jgi:hypothetical protein
MPYPAPFRVAFERGPQDHGLSEGPHEEEDGKIEVRERCLFEGEFGVATAALQCRMFDGDVGLEDSDIREDMTRWMKRLSWWEKKWKRRDGKHVFGSFAHL